MQTPFGVLGLKKFQKYTKGCSSLKLGKTRAQPKPDPSLLSISINLLPLYLHFHLLSIHFRIVDRQPMDSYLLPEGAQNSFLPLLKQTNKKNMLEMCDFRDISLSSKLLFLDIFQYRKLVNWGQNRSLLKRSGRGEQRTICNTRVEDLYKFRVKNDGNISALLSSLRGNSKNIQQQYIQDALLLQTK